MTQAAPGCVCACLGLGIHPPLALALAGPLNSGSSPARARGHRSLYLLERGEVHMGDGRKTADLFIESLITDLFSPDHELAVSQGPPGPGEPHTTAAPRGDSRRLLSFSPDLQWEVPREGLRGERSQAAGEGGPRPPALRRPHFLEGGPWGQQRIHAHL